MTRVGVTLSETAYTPEAYAYKTFLEPRGFQVVLAPPGDLESVNTDIDIHFMGWRPFWRRSAKSATLEVHEYQSLSVPPAAHAKDRLKSLVNRRPAGRIFLNSEVRNKLRFPVAAPSLDRDMGVDAALFSEPPANPEYDLLYCGTLARPGLMQELKRLASLGLRLLVVGDADAETRQALPDVTFTGRMGRDELPGVFASARAGLNYTPDIHPFNLQTSTKTLEYCAAGLGLVSNRYAWSTAFCERRQVRPLWLDELDSKARFDAFTFGVADVTDLEWQALLERCRLDRFLEGLLQQ